MLIICSRIFSRLPSPPADDPGDRISGFRRWPVGLLVLVLHAVSPANAHPSSLPQAAPEAVGMRPEQLARIDQVVEQAIEAQRMPGCVVAIGHRGHLVFLKAYGHRRLHPQPEPMTVDTVFDMASITKPVATATSIMMLVEQGRLRLRDRVSKHIPEFAAHGKQQITIEQLLLHQGGLIPDNALSDYDHGREEALKRIYDLTPYVEPGSQFVYTDVGFILLADLVERLTGQNVHEFSQQHLFRPLAMHETGYLPSAALRQRAAVTEQRDGQWMQGEVHDPRAYRLGGIAGHAGLFSTATDLAIYAQMMLNGGTYQGVQILHPRTIQRMTAAYPVSRGTRGLGWDKQSSYSSNRGELFSEAAFGHGGFTGTVLWIDPELDLFVIFLSNRVHPDGKGNVNPLAGRIGTIAAAAIQPEPAEQQAATRPGAEPAACASQDATRPTAAENRSAAVPPVQTGLDVLIRQQFALLKDQRVGLITNQTGIDYQGRQNIRLMHESPHVQLVALFSPEHGLEGRLDVPKIDDTQDPSTGIAVFSLYGATRKPTAEQLSGIDTLVFDIQDIGTRFYTYISTMGLAMEAAAEHGKRFVVLDRPNPINGIEVAGPVLDAGQESFVGCHTLPVRHGMTVGELARLLCDEWDLDLQLEIVRMEGWQRDQWFDQTGQWWINPSPNMRNLNQALLYPGIGLLETTNISVGRGTDTPFELIGAPWIDGQELAARLNAARLPGLQFMPRHFVPSASVHAGKRCEGVQIAITDRSRVQPVRTGLQIACLLRQLYPDDWDTDRFHRLLSDTASLQAVVEGKPVSWLMQHAQDEAEAFQQRRQAHLLYP